MTTSFKEGPPNHAIIQLQEQRRHLQTSFGFIALVTGFTTAAWVLAFAMAKCARQSPLPTFGHVSVAVLTVVLLLLARTLVRNKLKQISLQKAEKQVAVQTPPPNPLWPQAA